MDWPVAVIVVAVVAVVGCIRWTVIVSDAFKAWLEQRERERLAAIDKAELAARMDVYDAKLLEMKNIVASTRSR